jgi:hypothetical protein
MALAFAVGSIVGGFRHYRRWLSGWVILGFVGRGYYGYPYCW